MSVTSRRHCSTIFSEIRIDRLSLLNVIPQNTPEESPMRGQYLPVPRFVGFLQELFHLWWPRHHNRIRIRELDDLITKTQRRTAASMRFCRRLLR